MYSSCFAIVAKLETSLSEAFIEHRIEFGSFLNNSVRIRDLPIPPGASKDIIWVSSSLAYWSSAANSSSYPIILSGPPSSSETLERASVKILSFELWCGLVRSFVLLPILDCLSSIFIAKRSLIQVKPFSSEDRI